MTRTATEAVKTLLAWLAGLVFFPPVLWMVTKGCVPPQRSSRCPSFSPVGSPRTDWFAARRWGP
jgi:hypothetical protein